MNLYRLLPFTDIFVGIDKTNYFSNDTAMKPCIKEDLNCLLKEVCAVVVAYFPDSDFSANIIRIAKQTGKVVIVVNGHSHNHIEIFNRLSSRIDVKLILNPQNFGVATALNQGGLWAWKKGFRWALLFDQDTMPIYSMTEVLLAAYADFPDKEKLAIVGSNYYNIYNNRPRYKFSETTESSDKSKWRLQKTVITSGTLLNLKAFQAIGPFRDDFFIDFVDIEYCLRARAKGYSIIISCKPVMMHRLGTPNEHCLPWRTTGTSNHSALRRYYMTRNNIITAKRYIGVDPIWVVESLYSRFKSIMLMLLFEQDKKLKFKKVMLGFWHGICHK